VFKNIDINRGLLANKPTIITSSAADAVATAVTALWSTGVATSRALTLPIQVTILPCPCLVHHWGLQCNAAIHMDQRGNTHGSGPSWLV